MAQCSTQAIHRDARGPVEIEIGDGTRRVFHPGEILLAEDTTGQGHISRAVNGQPRKSLFIPLIRNHEQMPDRHRGRERIGADFPKAAKQGYSVCVNFHRDQTSAQNWFVNWKRRGQCMAYQADVSKRRSRLFFKPSRKTWEHLRLWSTMPEFSTFRPVSMHECRKDPKDLCSERHRILPCAREAVKRMSSKYGGTGGSTSTFLGSGKVVPGEYVITLHRKPPLTP